MIPMIKKMALIVLLVSGVALAAETDTVDVQWFADNSATGGKSHLTRVENRMVLLTVEAEGLVPGDAYTLWWVVFNSPENCSDPCNGDDFAGNIGAAQIAVGNASGNVAKSDGTLEFGARLPVGANTPGHQVLFNAGGAGDAMLLSAEDAEIHLVVQSHGQARGGKQLLQQLSLVNSACTPACADVQFAVHLP